MCSRAGRSTEAFFREKGLNNSETSSHLLVVADGDGSDQVVAKTDPLVKADSDSIAWSPDGGLVAVAADDPTASSGRAIYFVDASDGVVTTLPGDEYSGLEVFWRPSDERQLMFVGGPESNPGLFLFSVDDGSVVEVALPDRNRLELRPVGWMPDGQRFAYHRFNAAIGGFRTHAIDLATGVETVIGPAYGRLSNDGTRIAGFDSNERLCVAPVAGGECVLIGSESQAPGPAHRAGLQWSPDDEWLIVQPASGGDPILLDPDAGTEILPPWLQGGGESWQRVAP